MRKTIITALFFTIVALASAQVHHHIITLADPTIFTENDTCYLYGTGSPDGFPVYISTNLSNWHRYKKNALQKGDSYGDKKFWAPQIFKHNQKYYMAYAANEHVAIAQANSPLGPFTQSVHQSVSIPGKHIDPFIFKDSDGKLYLYFVRLQNGNRIFVARLKDDLSDIEPATITECLHAETGWENTANASWPVAEGPSVIKMGGMYYLFYSCNDFRNINYAVGYATAASPTGPWIKYNANPILSKLNTKQNGSGHGDLFTTGNKIWYYVFHTHNSDTTVNPRKTALVRLDISKGKIVSFSIAPQSFRYLESQ